MVQNTYHIIGSPAGLDGVTRVNRYTVYARSKPDAERKLRQCGVEPHLTTKEK